MDDSQILIPGIFALLAFILIALAETGRVPVDNPATHLELTMIHEAMILEYSGRHLALIEWAGMMKLFLFTALGIASFFPWGIAPSDDIAAFFSSSPDNFSRLSMVARWSRKAPL